MQIIAQDLADTDFYTYTMGQMIFNQFPNAIVKYKYKNRTKNYQFRAGFADELKEQIELMSDLRMRKQMIQFFSEKTPWLKPTYLQWLANCFTFKPEQVKIFQTGGELDIEIVGPWFETVFWEEPLLYTITELSHTDPKTGKMMVKVSDWKDRIRQKAERLSEAGVNWIDFGTRRRFSFEVQDNVCDIMRSFKPLFRGTSNPFLAQKYNIPVFGTFAHQLPMALQASYGLQQCNIRAMEHWLQEYRGDLGIALLDTTTTPKFLEIFDSFYARLFDGVRQDSGNPKEIGDMVIKHYEKLRIDPTTKVLVLSDSLNVDKAIELHNYFKGRIRTTMGIGTHITNDVGYTPINHVIKLVAADFGQGMKDVVKISDDNGKAMGGSQDAIDIAKRVLDL